MRTAPCVRATPSEPKDDLPGHAESRIGSRLRRVHPYPPFGGLLTGSRIGKLPDMYGPRTSDPRLLAGTLIVTLTGCDGSPSRNILGSYFPSWMVCAVAGIVLALVARTVFKATGILEELPA